MELGEFIKKYREENDLSLREFANKSGLSHAYIAKLESGIDPRSGKKVEPTLDTIKKIADATDTQLIEILKLMGYVDADIEGKSERMLDEEIKDILSNLDPEFIDILKDLEGMTKEEKKVFTIFLEGMKLRRNK